MTTDRRLTPFALRAKVRRLPGGGPLVRVGVFLLGLGLIALGLALAVLPGPLTLPPVLLGLFVWASEFRFAERLLDKALDKAREAWAAARAHPVRSGLVTGAGLLAVAALATAAVQLDLVGSVQRRLR